MHAKALEIGETREIEQHRRKSKRIDAKGEQKGSDENPCARHAHFCDVFLGSRLGSMERKKASRANKVAIEAT